MPEGIHAVIVHPHLFVSTKQARAILSRTVNMSDFVWQTANLAGFISGCYTNDLDMIRASFEDVVIENAAPVADPRLHSRCARPPWRPARWAARFPARARRCSRCALEADAAAVRDAMVSQFARQKLQVDDWIVAVQSGGARVVDG